MKKIKILGLIAAGILMASCNSGKNNPNSIKVGITSGPEQEIAETAKKSGQRKIQP